MALSIIELLRSPIEGKFKLIEETLNPCLLIWISDGRDIRRNIFKQSNCCYPNMRGYKCLPIKASILFEIASKYSIWSIQIS